MSDVVIGNHKKYGRVVLKQITNRLAGIERFSQRWDQEIMISKILSSVTRVPEVFESGDRPRKWALYKYIGTRTLQDWINDQRYPIQKKKRLEACSIIHNILDIIVVSSSLGIIHRDITPSNVVIDEYCKPFLIDWGLAYYHKDERRLEIPDAIESFIPSYRSNRLTEFWRRHGRPGYAAPEQATAFFDSPSIKNDIYSLTVLAIHLISGRAPFGEDGEPNELIDRQKMIHNKESVEQWIIDLFGYEITEFLLADVNKRSIDVTKLKNIMEGILNEV